MTGDSDQDRAAPRPPGLKESDTVRAAALEGAVWHLDTLARCGHWDALCDRLHDRLGRLGLGRN